MTDSAQNAELSKPVTRTAYFVEFHFASGIVRVSNFNVAYQWGGHTWGGLGELGAIDQVQESEAVESRPLNFTLNAVNSALLAEGLGPVEDYRGRDAKMYFCPVDENYALVNTPELCWRGIMDTVTFGVEGDQGSIMLKCETSTNGLKRQAAIRVNAAQQKKKYPTDTGLDYLTDLIANPQLWLSKKFQQQ